MDVVAGEAVAVLKSLGYIWKLDLEILTMTVLVSLLPASHARSFDHLWLPLTRIPSVLARSPANEQAWGNSIGDLVADISVARSGQLDMAVTACCAARDQPWTSPTNCPRA